MKGVASLALAVLASACQAAPTAPTQASARATAAAPSSASPLAAKDAIASLERRKTPAELRRADEAACASGDVQACRRMADRHRGYGAAAGCGLDRGRAVPSLKRLAEDTDADERGYEEYIGRACQLGDREACALERLAPASWTLSTATAENGRVRSSTEGSALWRWARETRPEHAALLDAARKECFGNPNAWSCHGTAGQLYRRDAKPKPELPDAVKQRALAICRATLECSDVLMMLDKEVYPLEAVAPVRAEMAKVLVEACLDGACVCGEAARLLGEDDPRRAALAKAGCDDGEAEACFELARALEEGRGTAKDEARAAALHDLACPSMRPREGQPGPRQGEYSPRACDAIARRYERGEMPPKQRAHAFFYAEAACQRPGFERDHAPCIRLARYHTHGPNTGRNREDAHIASLGPQGHPVNRKECTRPSIEAACKTLEEEIQRAGR